jgi:type I restriction enzyme S subunit
MLETGDILMSVRATVGTTAMVPTALKGANLSRGIARIAPGESVDGTYLLEYIRSDSGQRWIASKRKGITFLEINIAKLREMPVPLPPLDLQQEFARRVETIERLKNTHRRSLEEMDALFASLQHRAFRGEL